MLIKRWRYSLLVTAATFLIIFASPVVAAFNNSFLYPKMSFSGAIQKHFSGFINLTSYKNRTSFLDSNNSIFSTDTVTIADSSIFSTKQKQQASSILHQLNLTQEQQEQIKKIHHKYKKKLYKKKENLIMLQQQLSDLMVSTKPSDLIRAKNQQLVSLRQEIGELRFESMLATREILTPQQRQKFREIIESQ